MAQTFFPKESIKVKASAPHEDAEYVISVGTEIWGKDAHQVIKVQMAYGGKISGRRSPSYPVGTDDYERVNEAVKTIIEGLNEE